MRPAPLRAHPALLAVALTLSGCPSASEAPCGPAADPAPPTARGDLAGAFDPGTGRLVVVGGDVGADEGCAPRPSYTAHAVAFDPSCGGFFTLGGGTVPFARGGHALAADRARGLLYVHGGRHRAAGASGDYAVFGDLWRLDAASGAWEEIERSGLPAGRFDHVLVRAGERLLLHGGNTATTPAGSAPRVDLWAFSPATSAWEQLAASNGPAPRAGHAAAASPNGDRVYVYGGTGAGETGPYLGDLWQLDVANAAWTLLSDGLEAGAGRRVDAALAVDPASNRLLLFGGRDDANLGPRNDVLAFDLSGLAWSVLAAGDAAVGVASPACDRPADSVEQDLLAPERRAGAAVDLDDAGRLLVYGGRGECGPLDDAWRWSGEAGWEELHAASTGASCARRGEACAGLCF